MRKLPLLIPDNLPCDPCPHHSPCCKYGAMLLPSEADHLSSRFGKHTVVFQTGSLRKDHWDITEAIPSGENVWYTAVVNGYCVFLRDNQCQLHNSPDYPLRCLFYPQEDYFHGGGHPPDATLCPEVKANDDEQ